jgi:hypothetical protein
LGIFLLTITSRTVLGPTQPPIQWVPGALSLGVRRLGREADHSSPDSSKFKKLVEPYIHSTNTPSERGAQLKKKAQGQLPCALYMLHKSILFDLIIPLSPIQSFFHVT